VPYEHTLQLQENAKMAVINDLYIVPGGTHNDSWYMGGQMYKTKTRKFIEKAIEMNGS